MNIDFNSAYSPIGSGAIKTLAEDFVVDENLPWNFSDSGEHLYCRIRKTGLGTAEAIGRLATHLGCSVRDIGYAGLKDKRAVTTQWISMPFKYPIHDPDKLVSQGIEILESRRHYRKLRQGNLLGNSFVIRIRQIDFNRASLSQRLRILACQGFPNYFGQQRFGRDFRNLNQALYYLANGQSARLKRKNGFYLSCLRSYLFNLVLSERVRLALWNQRVVGDILQLSGSHSVFIDDGTQESLAQRFMLGDVQPAGLLWGKKRLSCAQDAKEIERSALLAVSDVVEQMESLDLKAGYRPFVAMPRNLRILEFNLNDCLLGFELDSGQYATELLKNIFSLSGES